MTAERPHARSELFDALAQLGISTRTLDHPPVHTVAESRDVYERWPGSHTKNLFLKDAKGALFLIVAEAHTSVDLKVLPQRINSARLSFGSADLLRDVLGVEPGSVTAFAVMNDNAKRVTVVLDERLIESESINCHPMENTATTNIARDDLLRFIRSTGHEPHVRRLTSATA